jgi:hypothetical protein
MRSRGSQNRLSGSNSFGSRVSALIFAMIATMATIYVAGRYILFHHYNLFSELQFRLLINYHLYVMLCYGICRLWQDAQSRVYLIKQLEKRTSQVQCLFFSLTYSSFITALFRIEWHDTDIAYVRFHIGTVKIDYGDVKLI